MMKKQVNLILTLVFGLLLSACEGMDKRLYERTPHIPVFAGIVKGAESDSNPYWSRFTAVNDEVTVRMDTGGIHTPEKPSLYGSLGTYYRMPKDYYLYMMTGGYGVQYDYFIGDDMKISPSLYLGFAGTKGASFSISKKVGSYRDGDLIAYAAVQRQEIRMHLFCIDTENSCSAAALNGKNEVRAHQDILNYLVGLQMGRFKLGSKGNTTLLFKVELGLHEVLSNKITYEQFAPTNFEPEKSAPLISFYADFTLW